MLKRVFSSFMCFCFVLTSVFGPGQASASELFLPAPGALLLTTPAYVPVMMRGLQVHGDNSLLFDFIIDTGKSGMKVTDPAFKAESEKLIKYFLAALTVKEEDLWVNLSPYEKDRMITQELGSTELGRDMLAQDYVLKQLTASLIYPEKEVGKNFWDQIYREARVRFGTTDIPIDTFNKVWITADKAKVLERNDAGYVVGGHLKVLLESDYLAQSKEGSRANDAFSTEAASSEATTQAARDMTRQIVREVIIPVLEKEVNEGAHFANLRQIFHAMILASWYKTALKDALLAKVYGNTAKVGGVGYQEEGALDDGQMRLDPEKIYEEYLEAYKKGVFNYIKEETELTGGEALPRKYFSGGLKILRGPVERVTGLLPGENIPGSGESAMVSARMSPLESAMAVPGEKGNLKILIAEGFPKQRLEALQKDPICQGASFTTLPVSDKDSQNPSVARVFEEADGFYDAVLIDTDSYNEITNLRRQFKGKVITTQMFADQRWPDPQEMMDILALLKIISKDEGADERGRIIVDREGARKILEESLPEEADRQALMNFLMGRTRSLKVFTTYQENQDILRQLDVIRAQADQADRAMTQKGIRPIRQNVGRLAAAGLLAIASILSPMNMPLTNAAEVSTAGIAQSTAVTYSTFTNLYRIAQPYIKVFENSAQTLTNAFPGVTRSYQGYIPSEHNTDIEKYGASSYDLAGLARIQLLNDRDTTLLDTLVDNWEQRSNIFFNHENGFRNADGVSLNGIPFNIVRIQGRDVPNWWSTWDWNVEQGGAAEMITLAIDAYRKTDRQRYLDFARGLADALLPLQDSDGGFRFGPIGIWHPSGLEFFWNLKVTEKNARILSALQNLYSLTAGAPQVPYENKYGPYIEALKTWLKGMYNKDEHLFHTSAEFDGSTWVKSPLGTANEYFATDVTAMMPDSFILRDLFFGATQQERDQEVRAMVDATEQRMAFKNADGLPVFFRFSSGQSGEFGSVEWTSQMALFYLRLALFYDGVDQKRFDFYYERFRTLVFSMKNDFMKTASEDPLALVAPYASYMNGEVAGGEESGIGFDISYAEASLASSVWFSFALNGFDPNKHLGGPGLPLARPVIGAIKILPGSSDREITIKDPVGVKSYDVYSAASLADANWVPVAVNIPVSGRGATTWRDTRPGLKQAFYKVVARDWESAMASLNREGSSGISDDKVQAALRAVVARLQRRSEEGYMDDRAAWMTVLRAARYVLGALRSSREIREPVSMYKGDGEKDLLTVEGSEDTMRTMPFRAVRFLSQALAALDPWSIGYTEKPYIYGRSGFELSYRPRLRLLIGEESIFQGRDKARERMDFWLEQVSRLAQQELGDENFSLPRTISRLDAVVVDEQNSEPFYAAIRLQNGLVIYHDILKEIIEIQHQGVILGRLVVSQDEKDVILQEVKDRKVALLAERFGIQVESAMSVQRSGETVRRITTDNRGSLGLLLKMENNIRAGFRLSHYNAGWTFGVPGFQLEVFLGTREDQARAFIQTEQFQDILARLSSGELSVATAREEAELLLQVRKVLDSLEQGKIQAGASGGRASAENDNGQNIAPGGIDLDAGKMGLDIDRQGGGLWMEEDPAVLKKFQEGNFSGITPVIIQITPVSNPAAVLGFS